MATYTQQCSKVGSFSYASNFILYVTLTERDVSINDNTSYVDYNVYCQSSGSGSINSRHLKYFSINGEEKINTTETVNASSPNAYISIASGSIGPIKHNDDGTKTISFSAQIQGASYGVSASISSNFTLTTIQRKSQVGLSSTSITLGNALTIYTNSASSNFTHNLYWQVGGGSWNTIAKGVTNSYVWNTSSAISSIASKFPNSKTGNLTVNCETYNGSTYLGHTSTTLFFTITSQPIVSSISTSGGINGVFVEDVSSVTTNVTASGIYGSSISTYRMEMYNGNTKIKESYGSSASATFSLTGLNLSEDTTITLKATVTDTRGNTNSSTTTIPVTFYFKPQIRSRYATRVNSSGTSDSNGTYLYIYWAYSIRSIPGVVKDKIIVQYRQKGASDWIPVTVPNEGAIIVGDGGISTDYQYEVQFIAGDGISNDAVITDTIPTGSVTVDYRAGGKGIAFGKVSEKDEFECNMVADFKNTISWESVGYNNTDYNTMKKAGIYYMSVDCANGPENNYLRLLVMGASYSGDVVQIASSVVNGKTWIRGCSNGVWHQWTEINQIWHKGVSDDFNNFTTTGIYICSSTPTGLNSPISMAGVLEVINNAGLILQRYTTYEGSLVFQRGYNSGWTVWKKVAGTIMKTNMLSARTTVSGAAWAENIIPLDTTKTDTSIGLLSARNYGISIESSNINTVKISASISFYNYNATGEVDLHILKNSEVVASAGTQTTVSNQIMTIVTNTVGINVSSEDVIYLSIIKNNDTSLTLLEGTSTSLTVEVIN